MNSPKISVIIPAYNHEKYVGEAVHSVLEQHMTDFELIIVNDGSRDRSEQVILSIQDRRIRYFTQNNQGAHNTINRGIGLARGEYVSILNSDDAYYPERLGECLKTLEKNASLHAVFSHVEFIDETGKHIKYRRGAEPHRSEISLRKDGFLFPDLLGGNFLVSTSNLFCRKSVFEHIALFSNLRYAHDYEFFLRLCYHFKVRMIDSPLLKYRIHNANTIRENEAETNFEVGIVLSEFLLNHDIRKFFPDDDVYALMAKFFNSVNPLGPEKMMMTLLLFGTKCNIGDDFFRLLAEDTENPFRKICTDYLRNHIDAWQDAQLAWKKWHESNQQLIRANRKISEKEEDAKKWWLNAREGWEKWHETNRRLVLSEKRLESSENKDPECHPDLQQTLEKCDALRKRLAETEKHLAETAEEAKKWWLSSQEGWKKWHETNHRLIETENRLVEKEKEAKKWWLNSQAEREKRSEANRRLAETEEKLAQLEKEKAKSSDQAS